MGTWILKDDETGAVNLDRCDELCIHVHKGKHWICGMQPYVGESACVLIRSCEDEKTAKATLLSILQGAGVRNL